MYTLITTVKELEACIRELAFASCLALDTETTSLDERTGKLRLIQLRDGISTYIIDCFAFDSYDQLKILNPILTDVNVRKILHNFKFDFKWLKTFLDVEVYPVFDTFIASAILDFTREKGFHKLDSVIERFLSIEIDKSEQLSDWSGVLSKSQLNYAANDVLHLHNVREKQIELLHSTGQLGIAQIEFKCVPVLASMEMVGMPIDRDKYVLLTEEIERERVIAENNLRRFLQGEQSVSYIQYDIFGNPVELDTENTINLRSTPQILEAFRKKGITLESTDKKYIEPLALDFPDLNYLVKARESEKLCSSYGSNVLNFINPLTKRIHPDFIQMGTITGRISTRKPNTAQIPADKRFREPYRVTGDRRIVICLTGESRIATTEGLKEIKNIQAGDSIIDEDGGVCQVSDSVCNGVKEVFELETQEGFSIKATGNHQFLTLSTRSEFEWKKLSEIDTSDYIIVNSHFYRSNQAPYKFNDIIYPHYNNIQRQVPLVINESVAELLGIIVGDGHFSKNYLGIVVCDKDQDLITKVKSLLANVFGECQIGEFHYRGIHEFKLSSKPIVEWLKSNFISKDKLPYWIFYQPENIIKAFLRGYFESDGCITISKKSSARVSLKSSRYAIIRDVHSLLLSLGIVSSFKKGKTKLNNKEYKNYTVQIPHSELNNFKSIGFLSARKSNLLSESLTSSIRSNVGNFPNLKYKIDKYWDTLKDLKECRNIKFDKKRCLSVQGVRNLEERNPQIASEFQTHRVTKWSQRFFKVKAIISAGREKVYDITVPESGKFIANGITTHNCDWAGFELRILADYSDDEVMIDAFNSGKDLHSVSCANIFKVPYETAATEHKDLRKLAKVVNFSVVYGISPKALKARLAAQTGVQKTADEAKAMIEGFYRTYPGASRWLFSQEKIPHTSRTLTCPTGKRIKLEFDRKDDASLAAAGRDCRNYPIQATNSAALKIALYGIRKDIRDNNYDAQIINCVHDEVLVECHERCSAEVKEIVESNMIAAAQKYVKKVEIKADASICMDWSEKG